MRLLSYNIHKGIGGLDRRYDLQRIVSVIEHENPDLICLQEVDRNVGRSRHDDQPQLLGDFFHAVGRQYQLNVHLKEGGYGNLMLSRWGFLSHHQISLRYFKNKPRGAQLAVIDTIEGPLHLVNWHLSLTDKMRKWQTDYLLKHQLFREGENHPTIIIGDTNDWRNRLGPGLLREAGFQQITAPVSRFRSFPSYLGMGALDKAFFRGPIEVHQAHLIRTKLAKQASDHLPLVIDFRIQPVAVEDAPQEG